MLLTTDFTVIHRRALEQLQMSVSRRKAAAVPKLVHFRTGHGCEVLHDH